MSQKKLTNDVLKKRLDTLLKVVRYRGTNDSITNKCATCGRIFTIKELQCGHFIKRGNLVLKYIDCNLMPQCRRCNHFLDGAQDKAAYYIIKRYGLPRFEWLVETDQQWIAGTLPTPKREDLVRSYNYWLRENRTVEEQWKIKIIPSSWEPVE